MSLIRRTKLSAFFRQNYGPKRLSPVTIPRNPSRFARGLSQMSEIAFLVAQVLGVPSKLLDINDFLSGNEVVSHS